MTVLGNQEAVRMCQRQILKPQSSAIRDYLSGSKPRMHSFEALWWIYCSSFKRCAMVPDSSGRSQNGPAPDSRAGPGASRRAAHPRTS